MRGVKTEGLPSDLMSDICDHVRMCHVLTLPVAQVLCAGDGLETAAASEVLVCSLICPYLPGHARTQVQIISVDMCGHLRPAGSCEPLLSGP